MNKNQKKAAKKAARQAKQDAAKAKTAQLSAEQSAEGLRGTVEPDDNVREMGEDPSEVLALVASTGDEESANAATAPPAAQPTIAVGAEIKPKVKAWVFRGGKMVPEYENAPEGAVNSSQSIPEPEPVIEPVIEPTGAAEVAETTVEEFIAKENAYSQIIAASISAATVAPSLPPAAPAAPRVEVKTHTALAKERSSAVVEDSEDDIPQIFVHNGRKYLGGTQVGFVCYKGGNFTPRLVPMVPDGLDVVRNVFIGYQKADDTIEEIIADAKAKDSLSIIPVSFVYQVEGERVWPTQMKISSDGDMIIIAETLELMLSKIQRKMRVMPTPAVIDNNVRRYEIEDFIQKVCTIGTPEETAQFIHSMYEDAEIKNPDGKEDSGGTSNEKTYRVFIEDRELITTEDSGVTIEEQILVLLEERKSYNRVMLSTDNKGAVSMLLLNIKLNERT